MNTETQETWSIEIHGLDKHPIDDNTWEMILKGIEATPVIRDGRGKTIGTTTIIARNKREAEIKACVIQEGLVQILRTFADVVVLDKEFSWPRP